MESDDVTLTPCSPFPPDRPDGTARAIPAEWRTEAVVGLATGIREDRAFERLPILADALEEAGCTDLVLLRHCREPMTHTADCWAVNLALDRMPEVEPEPDIWRPLQLAPTLREPRPRVETQREPGSRSASWRHRIVSTVVLLAALVILKSRPSSEPPAQSPPTFDDASTVVPNPATDEATKALIASMSTRGSLTLPELGGGMSWLDRRKAAATGATLAR